MPEFPKVSIITVSYNAGKYIERTIKSVVAQTYPNIEYVIIDGASKDNTLQIVQQYEKQISLLVSEPDKSLYDAMNKGLARATGDYVVFMNAGDMIRQSDSLSEAMKGANGADLVYARAVYVNEAGEQREWHKKTPPPSELNAKSFMSGMVICHQCMIVKRSIAPQYTLGVWKVSSDIDWSIRVMKNVKTAHFWDGVFCNFLEGGLSGTNRYKAVKERFDISVLHFGWLSAVLAQIRIMFQIIRRGRIS